MTAAVIKVQIRRSKITNRKGCVLLRSVREGFFEETLTRRQTRGKERTLRSKGGRMCEVGGKVGRIWYLGETTNGLSLPRVQWVCGGGRRDERLAR